MRATLFLAAVLGTMTNLSSAKRKYQTRNLIYVVPDGFGPASQTLARDYMNIMSRKGTALRPGSETLEIDSMIIGSVRTQSFDNLVTDSAAAATAFASGHKTYNRGVGVDSNVKPVASVLEAAHLNGYKTGLVVTSRVTDATPACYCAHVMDRSNENEIAGHQIGQQHPLGPVIDLIMGGGRRHYLTEKKGGNRTEYDDLIRWAKAQNYTYVADKYELDGYTQEVGKVPLPFLGLFADGHMAYELDRDREREPSLLEMTQVALTTLTEATKLKDNGYFIMIEASRIDHAGHANDIAAHVHDVIMYNQVMAFLKDYVAGNPDTQLLSAADHECGGLTLKNGYNPALISRANHTTEYLEVVFSNYTGPDRAAYLKNVILPQYGFHTATDAETEKYLTIFRQKGVSKMGQAIIHDFAEAAGITWTTDGHSAVDVNLYGFAVDKPYKQMKEALSTHVDNTQLAKYVERALGLNLEKATEVLRDNWVKYEGNVGPSCKEGGDDECLSPTK